MQNTNTAPTPETDALMLAYGKATASGTERPAIWPLMKTLEQERNEMRDQMINTSPPPAPVKDWDYCPECGSEDHQPFHQHTETHRSCTNCGQDWHTDVDYSKAVQTNLAKAIKQVKVLRNSIPFARAGE